MLGEKIAIKNFLYAPIAYLGINLEVFTILTALIVIDTITGILKGATLNGKRSIKSSKLSFGLISKILLLLIPITLALAGRGVGVDLTTLVSATFSILILSESYSIVANIYSFRTGKEVEEYDAVSIILKKIRKVLHNV